ncbi:MAG: hypothetical protein WC205_15985 [Opitutaceae bacterium]|jgi:hypothetical protein
MKISKPNSGFALLITITLLAFLVLLLVSLASLTRVETQVASNNQQLSQARQNALMALQLSLGQLQKLAGPDQRATTTAEINATGQNGTRFWTGVWGNGNTADDYQSTPRLLNWLVSGNEQIAFTAETTAAAFGQISATATPDHVPTEAVVLGAATTTGALTTDATLKAQPARVLMGPGSVLDAKDYVLAPLVNIEVPASTVPGLSGATATTVGRYAWWVGDEGVKAKLNTVDRWRTTASTNAERFNRLLVTERYGIEQVSTDIYSAATPAVFGAAVYNESDQAFRESLAKVTNYSQAGLLTGFSTAAPKAGISRRRHDLSTYSTGVLADQRRGGLRKDLTVLFDTNPGAWTGALKTSLDEASYIYSDGVRRVADFQSGRLYGTAYSMNPGVAKDGRSPKAATWEQLGSYYRLAQTNTGTTTATAQTNTQMAVFPVVQWARIAFDVTCAADGSGGQLHFIPQVALWNPYNTTLRGEYRIRFEFSPDWNAPYTTLSYLYLASYALNPDGTPNTGAPLEVYRRELFAAPRPGTGKYANNTLEFLIELGDIPAGQARIFTPKVTSGYNTNGNNTLANAVNTTTSFTRPIGHAFTPTQVSDTALAFASTGTAGGLLCIHLLDNAGIPLQLVDGMGLIPTVALSSTADPASATPKPTLSSTYTASLRALSTPRNLTGGVDYRHHIGFSYGNHLQANEQRLNWLAQYNVRAPSLGRTFTELGAGIGYSGNGGANTSYQTNHSSWDITELPSDSKRTYTGPRFDTTGLPEAVLFSLPRPETPVLSVGQLQHAVTSFMPSGQEPTYPLGNAYASPYIQQDKLLRPNTVASATTGAGAEAHLTDVSFLLNHALWDRFFFSSTPNVTAAQLQAQIAAGTPPANARIHYLGTPAAADVRDFSRAAAHLIVDGAFNVNSTSVEAWTALFASLRNVGVSPADGSAAAPVAASPFVRTPFVTGGADTASRTDQWTGYRSLTNERVLAVEVVNEIRTRGPFLSLGDFVNRRLAAYPDVTGLRGTLQAALDRLNTLNRPVLDQDKPASSVNDVPTGAAEVWTVNTSSYYLQAIKAPRSASSTPATSKAAMAPGFLSQADLLSALGPVLSARSDTFVVRAYGETVNPLLAAADAGYVTGRAWCEAVVQRLPDYVDSTGNAAEIAPVTGATVNLTSDNQKFGRRFKVVSFRWLSPADI